MGRADHRAAAEAVADDGKTPSAALPEVTIAASADPVMESGYVVFALSPTADTAAAPTVAVRGIRAREPG